MSTTSPNKPRVIVDADAIIGRNLKTIRIARNISQNDLGKAAGLTFQQIGKYEKATNRIPASRLFQFATILECKLDDFYDGIKKTSTLEKFTTFSDVRILHAYHAIASKKQRSALLNLARAMAETDQIGGKS